MTKIESPEERGGEFVSLTEGIDTTSSQGRLAFHLFGAVAEFEWETQESGRWPVYGQPENEVEWRTGETAI